MMWEEEYSLYRKGKRKKSRQRRKDNKDINTGRKRLAFSSSLAGHTGLSYTLYLSTERSQKSFLLELPPISLHYLLYTV